MNYAGNSGGPGVISWDSGTIVDMFTCSTTNQFPINSWPVGTCWWSANPNFAYFGFDAITDGSSNTGLFSEHLLGYAAGTQGPPPSAGSANAKRAIYSLTTGIPNSNQMSSGNAVLALQAVQACRSVPGNAVPSDPNGPAGGWWLGFSWALGFPWHYPTNRYFHNNTPNGLSCTNPSDQCCGLGGTDPLITATSNHPGGVNVCFTDGSVRFVKDSVNPQTWWALGSKSGGEVVSADSY
jgi:prepilin-type processing-associated H-X9-DG protein